MMRVFPSLSFFVSLQCCLASFGRPSDTGAPLVVLDYECCSWTRSLVPRHHVALAVLERDKGAVAVRVELETLFLLLVDLVKGQ